MSKLTFWLLAVGHLILFGLIYWLAYLLRFGFDVPPFAHEAYLLSLPVVLVVKLVVFWGFGHYHGWHRYVSVSDFRALTWACLVSFGLMACVDYFSTSYHAPRGILVLDGLLSIVILATLRVNGRVAATQSTT
jgi:FlaA1/EpsC-like NDP-sugar epimerase